MVASKVIFSLRQHKDKDNVNSGGGSLSYGNMWEHKVFFCGLLYWKRYILRTFLFWSFQTLIIFEDPIFFFHMSKTLDITYIFFVDVMENWCSHIWDVNQHIDTSTQHAHNLASHHYPLYSFKTYLHGIGDKMLMFKTHAIVCTRCI